MTALEDSSLPRRVFQQRALLTGLLYEPMRRLADACSRVWGDRPKMETALSEAFSNVPYCKFLYVLDTGGVQITSNISREGLLAEHFGRDRSDRPYVREALLAAEYSNKYREAQYQQWPYIREGVQAVDFLLCEAYISLHALRPSLTAVQFVRDTDGTLLGFIGADFALRDLPQAGEIYEEPRYPRRFEGDPFISDTADTKMRSESKMDRYLDTVLSVVEELILVHGVYHIILHFSSSQAILWVMDDPYRYRLLTIDELIDPNICLAYPKRPYPDEAVVPQQEVRKILSNLRTLRFMQGIFYLRSGSVNIFNGTVGLTFSSDCSHYISHDDFLKRDHTLWNNG
ncbi:PDC sensor domain-containing protein [Acidithiobacillus ferridurans]|uniref:hypothetical protein n=1 Tax=Acidithiobacillus ferridurans TaxID=1232575 RepID=UPI001C079B8D|nr:hypothetical protein [Acidithiobacillus ferridurans]MBU2732470.1 hypothetical protein [Acidithiobacillus ferridurans]